MTVGKAEAGQPGAQRLDGVPRQQVQRRPHGGICRELASCLRRKQDTFRRQRENRLADPLGSLCPPAAFLFVTAARSIVDHSSATRLICARESSCVLPIFPPFSCAPPTPRLPLDLHAPLAPPPPAHVSQLCDPRRHPSRSTGRDGGVSLTFDIWKCVCDVVSRVCVWRANRRQADLATGTPLFLALAVLIFAF